MNGDARRPVEAREAERITFERFGVRADAEGLPGEYDDNFLLEESSGRRFVLKVAPPDASEELLDCQNRALNHVAGRSTGLRVPQVFTNREGRATTPLTIDGQRRLVRLLTYLPGRLLADCATRTPELHRDVGRFLGELDRALSDFDHPAARREFQWDLRHAGQQRRLARCIRNSARRALAEHFFLQFDACALPALGDLRTGVIHNDANDYNLVVDESKDPPRMGGLIDFGDLVHTATICELGVALAYVMMGRDDPLATAADVVGGYHGAYPLTEAEIDVLFPLVCARLATSVSISAHRHEARPDDAYATISEAPAWSLLEKLRPVSPNEARNRFREASGHAPATVAGRGPAELLESRRRRVGPNLSVAYESPLEIVRGSMQYLYDHEGRGYLDLVNNVSHVGHCHPRVVEAARAQIELLNTNTRYLHANLVDYTRRLCATLPDPLDVCYLVCSGSEANELALRLARAHTRRRDVLVLDGAYHGNTTSLVEISPYKFLGPGGEGASEHVHVAPTPDGYRGPHRGTGAETGRLYADELEGVLGNAAERGRDIGAFIAEPLLGCGGQIVPPEGFLDGAFRAVRGAGGVCIADEVQVGFGRVGRSFWAFELQGVVPDIVTLGKPIGNGHPMAAVVTTSEIAASFDNGMEYFNTFGGNPVSCAVGLAVLDVIEDEGLQQRALEIGGRMLDGLRSLAERHPLIGDVRGEGLFMGVELVRDRESLDAADAEAERVIEELRTGGILVSTDGPLHNVLKIKPPLVLSARDADRTVDALDRALGRIEAGG
jgi:4-aminobutyrate aminotransferase-like enzyme/Ser/Thr protein kinase RdoA (MazF antagonist)